jgi:hypothetical protein
MTRISLHLPHHGTIPTTAQRISSLNNNKLATCLPHLLVFICALPISQSLLTHCLLYSVQHDILSFPIDIIVLSKPKDLIVQFVLRDLICSFLKCIVP